ncbi:MAG: transglutaminase family protein [Pseudomonadota bacterium]
MYKQTETASAYLAASAIIDYHHPLVSERAQALAEGVTDKLELARRCYEFVRDEIPHSFDINAEAVSCTASEVLQNGHGICYAQSHLLAALLRANAIPAGFDYQRLYDDDLNYCLHGFNSVYLPEFGWYRVDARGNTGEVDARFCPPHERLAFPTELPGEIDYGLNLSEPVASVVKALKEANSIEQLRRSLPTGIRMG